MTIRIHKHNKRIHNIIIRIHNNKIHNIQNKTVAYKTYNLIQKRYSSPVTGLEWPRGFQEVKVRVKQSRYRPGVAQRVPGS